MMPRYSVLLGSIVLAAAACSSARRTAQADLAAADRAFATIPAEARDVVPDQVAALTDAVKVGRQAFEIGQYQAASTSLHYIPDRVKDLVDSLPARKAALTAEMDTLAVVVPRNLDAIKAKLAEIDRTRRMPKGMSRQDLQAARDAYAAAGAQWSEITATFQKGELASAMAKAQDFKSRVSRVLLSLGLVADERAWSNVTLPPK